MIRSLFVSISCAVLLTPVLLSFVSVGMAQVMQSDNYQIESDSINVGGGRATSESYTIEDTTGEIATGESESESFQLRAGYQQMQQVLISLSQPESVEMLPSIPGVAGGFSNGSTTVTVITDNPAGYELLVSAEQTPALQAEGGAYTIADYVPSGSADYTFTTGSADAHLGYSIESTDAADRFLHDTETCGVGSTNTAQVCWAGLTTTPTAALVRSSSNHPGGTESIIHFRVGVGDAVSQPPGVYMATTTVTAVPL